MIKPNGCECAGNKAVVESLQSMTSPQLPGWALERAREVAHTHDCFDLVNDDDRNSAIADIAAALVAAHVDGEAHEKEIMACGHPWASLVYRTNPNGPETPLGSYRECRWCVERDALRAQVATLSELLIKVQWGAMEMEGEDMSWIVCPICRADPGRSHYDGCAIDKALHDAASATRVHDAEVERRAWIKAFKKAAYIAISWTTPGIDWSNALVREAAVKTRSDIGKELTERADALSSAPVGDKEVT